MFKTKLGLGRQVRLYFVLWKCQCVCFIEYKQYKSVLLSLEKKMVSRAIRFQIFSLVYVLGQSFYIFHKNLRFLDNYKAVDNY